MCSLFGYSKSHLSNKSTLPSYLADLPNAIQFRPKSHLSNKLSLPSHLAYLPKLIVVQLRVEFWLMGDDAIVAGKVRLCSRFSLLLPSWSKNQILFIACQFFLPLCRGYYLYPSHVWLTASCRYRKHELSTHHTPLESISVSIFSCLCHELLQPHEN